MNERFFGYNPIESTEPTTLKEHDPPVWEQCRNAFTPRQKEAIRARDQYKCQFPEHLNGHAHECGGKKEIHHIMPQGYCKELGINPDFAENGLLICRNAHDNIHPDSASARKGWRPKSDAFVKVQEARRELLNEHKIYWEPEWDREMHAMAVKNTQKAESNGWKFPNGKDLTDPRLPEVKPNIRLVEETTGEVTIYVALPSKRA